MLTASSSTIRQTTVNQASPPPYRSTCPALCASAWVFFSSSVRRCCARSVAIPPRALFLASRAAPRAFALLSSSRASSAACVACMSAIRAFICAFWLPYLRPSVRSLFSQLRRARACCANCAEYFSRVAARAGAKRCSCARLSAEYCRSAPSRCSCARLSTGARLASCGCGAVRRTSSLEP